VGQQQQRLLGTRALVAHHQVALVRVGLEEPDLVGLEARIQQVLALACAASVLLPDRWVVLISTSSL
jgi:hypothetical protein